MGDSAHTTHHTPPGKKSAPLLFLEDENIFQKSATLVEIQLQFRVEKKGGVLMLFKTTPHLRAKAQY
jgi:hypothetical protein